MLRSIKNTPLRERSRFAKFLAIFRFATRPYLNDHHARDIGLTVSEREQLRFELPSQSKDRPML